MPNTYPALYAHIIFATKERRPLISEVWRGDLHAYIAGILRGQDTQPEIVGGVSDHVHMLTKFQPKAVLPDIVREVKKAATFWVQGERAQAEFGWQGGYAIFSVSPFERRDLIAYIANQEAHHATESSDQELLRILDAAGVEFDRKYFE